MTLVDPDMLLSLIEIQGEDFLLQPGEITFTGVFNQDSTDELGVRTQKPVVFARSCDLINAEIEDFIFRCADGERYILKDRQKDGLNGLELLFLDHAP